MNKDYPRKPMISPLKKKLTLDESFTGKPSQQELLTPSLQPLSADNTPYAITYSSPMTTDVLALNTRHKEPEEFDRITGNAVFRQGGTTLTISNFGKLGVAFKTSTLKLFDFCVTLLTAENSSSINSNGKIINQVTFPIAEYTEICGKSNTKASIDKMRRSLRKDFEVLRVASLGYAVAPSTREDLGRCSIVTAYYFSKGNAVVDFHPNLVQFFANAFLSVYPLSLYQTDERNENAYSLGRRLAVHASIDNNIRRGTADKIKVSNVLDHCPALPEYEEVMKGNRAVYDRIIKPFEETLNKIPDLDWKLTNEEKKPYTEEELENRVYRDFNEFMDSYIVFKFKGEPDHVKRLASKSKEGRREQKKKTSGKRKPRKETT